MKKRSVIISVLALVALLAAGATMAWFTSNPEAVDNTFTAGTVEIEVDEGDFEDAENVNPGDSYDKVVKVKSLGSKATYVRVKLTSGWTKDGVAMTVAPDKDPASYEIGTDWIDGGDGWYYYKHIMNGGETTPLITEVKFNGPGMGNAYQGATFSLKVEAQAVQASHEAYKDATTWGLSDLPAGVEVWNE